MATYPSEVLAEVGEAPSPSAKSLLKHNRSVKPTQLGKRSKLRRRSPTSLRKNMNLANLGVGRTRTLGWSVLPNSWSMAKMTRRGARIAVQDVAIKTSPPIFASKSRWLTQKEHA